MTVSWCHISFQRQSYPVISSTCPSKSTHMLSSGPFKMRTAPEELLSNMLEKNLTVWVRFQSTPLLRHMTTGHQKNHQRKGRFLWEHGRPGRLKKTHSWASLSVCPIWTHSYKHTQKCVPPMFWVTCPIWTHSYRHTQKCAPPMFWVTLNHPGSEGRLIFKLLSFQ